jgi:hypothetical protein
MKFTKLDLQNCLLSKCLADFNGEVEYFCEENKERNYGNFGIMTIGISYSSTISKTKYQNHFNNNTTNKIEYQNHFYFNKNINYTLYILEQENNKNTEVYSYSFLGIFNGAFGTLKEKETTKYKIPLIDSEINELRIKQKEQNNILKQLKLKLEDLKKLFEKEQKRIIKRMNISLIDLNKILKKEQWDLINNNELIKNILKEIKEQEDIICHEQKIKNEIRSNISINCNSKNQKEKFIKSYLNSPYSHDVFYHFNRKVEKYYLLNNSLYYINIENDKNKYNDEQIKLLLKEFVYKENSKFDKLRKQIELYEKINLQTENNRKREPIPEDIRFEIWRRDEGKCVICGSKENLEFDHIIPFSKGGGNTVRNLQLLCESCNRKKSDKI